MNGGRGPLVVIDNYDSFTYNLCQYLGDLGVELRVVKNDELTVAEVRALAPCGVLVSPGPGCPAESGISLAAVRELGPDFPLFGVCMGHQCIGEAFGGEWRGAGGGGGVRRGVATASGRARGVRGRGRARPPPLKPPPPPPD
jgi:anthranilate synthase component 2